MSNSWHTVVHKGEQSPYLQAMVLHLCHHYNIASVTPARNVWHNFLFFPACRRSRLLVCIALYEEGWGAVLQQNEIKLLASPAMTVVLMLERKSTSLPNNATGQLSLSSHSLAAYLSVYVTCWFKKKTFSSYWWKEGEVSKSPHHPIFRLSITAILE